MFAFCTSCWKETIIFWHLSTSPLHEFDVRRDDQNTPPPRFFTPPFSFPSLSDVLTFYRIAHQIKLIIVNTNRDKHAHYMCSYTIRITFFKKLYPLQLLQYKKTRKIRLKRQPVGWSVFFHENITKIKLVWKV